MISLSRLSWSVRLLTFLFVLSFSSLVSPFKGETREAVLFKGDVSLGQVPVMDEEKGYVVSIADVGALLGFEASVEGEELLLSSEKNRLKIVLDAVAAWHNGQLIPLYGPSYVREGKWWLDVSSTLTLFQRIAGRSAAQRLRFEEASATTQATTEVQGHKTPVVENIPSQQTEPLRVSDPENTSQAVQVVAVTPSETKATPNSQKSVQQDVQPVRDTKKLEELPHKEAAQTSQPPVQQIGKKGELRAVRWSTSKEKVRAVLDCSEGAEPDIKITAGKVSVVFDSMVKDLPGLPSPYENVSAEASVISGLKTASFSASGVRLEKLILENPRRIVFDFIFASPSLIKEIESPQIAEESVETSTAAVPEKQRTGKLLVVLDPGHGGKDPGAVANGVKEKDLNLAIGLKLEKVLKAKGINVYMTRNTDVYLKLQERTDIANSKNADMFVSIHANALPPGKNSAGFEIYLMALPTDKDALALAKFENREYVEDKNNGATSDRKTELLLRILGDMQQNNKINESTEAAEVLFKSANRAGLPMKRVAQAPFFVLRGAGMPAVLLETGYLTNPKEAKLLAHPGYQQKIADALAAGIYDYLN